MIKNIVTYVACLKGLVSVCLLFNRPEFKRLAGIPDYVWVAAKMKINPGGHLEYKTRIIYPWWVLEAERADIEKNFSVTAALVFRTAKEQKGVNIEMIEE